MQELQGKRAAVLVEQQYQEMEVWYPVYRLREAGCKVTLVGPAVLCSTQALKGRKATCFFAIKDDVTNAGAQYVDAEVVRDGNLITSRKPDDLPAFLRTIIQAVHEAEP